MNLARKVWRYNVPYTQPEGLIIGVLCPVHFCMLAGHETKRKPAQLKVKARTLACVVAAV